jgi:hypothetical protein
MLAGADRNLCAGAVHLASNRPIAVFFATFAGPRRGRSGGTSRDLVLLLNPKARLCFVAGH